jgi:hypothetical protein
LFKSREEILALSKRRYGTYEGIRFQSLTEGELSTLRGVWAGRYAGRGEDVSAPFDLTSRRELLVVAIVDESGKRIFANDEADLLADLDSEVTEALHAAISAHCGIDRDEKAVDKIEKKSG